MTILTSNATPLWNIDTTFLGDVKCPFPREFLNCAITSHLRTSGCSVVVGAVEDVDKINMMINTLLIFLSPEQHQLCSHVREDNTYVPGMMIQGLTGDFDRMLTVNALYPTTVIDLVQTRLGVTQMSVKHHSKAREMYKASCIESVDQFKPLPDLLKEEFLFKPQKETSSFVQTLLTELTPLPSSLRVPLILHFRRLLERKSVVLIRCAECTDDNASTRSGPLKKRVKDILHANEADFAIIITIAEQISPGISVLVYGTIQDDLEKRFNDLWGVN